MSKSEESPPLEPSASEQYASATWFRATLAAAAASVGIAFPVVSATTAVLDLAITGRAQNVMQRRLAVLLNAWEDVASRLEATKLDRAFLSSEEFFDLLVQVW